MKNELPNESLWRGKMPEAKRAGLPAQPDLEIEARLTEALGKMPDASVTLNFTARVMQAIDLEEAQSARTRNWNWRSFLPRVAFAMLAIGFIGLTLHRYELDNRRAVLARNVALVAEAQPMPSVEALKNFDAIRRMSQPRADEELLALLQ